MEIQLIESKKIGNEPVGGPTHQQLKRLVEHYQNQRINDAEELASLFIKKFPKHQFSWKLLGAIMSRTGRLVEAVNINQKAVELCPSDAEAHYNLAVTLQRLGKLNEAGACYDQAIILKPDYIQALINSGIALRGLGKLKAAEKRYRKAISLKFDHAEAHFNLGITLKSLGKIDEAETSFRQALDLNKNYVEALNNLGVLMQEQGRLEESEASLQQMIALKPNYVDGINNLGITLKGLGKLKKSEWHLRQAVSLSPQHAESHINLGITLQELGRLREAEACYQQALKIKPDHVIAHNNIAFCLQDYIWKTFHGIFKTESSFEKIIELERKRLLVRFKAVPLWFVDIPRTSSSTTSAIMWDQFGFPFGKQNKQSDGKLIHEVSPLLPNHTHAFIAKHLLGKSLWDEIQTFTIVRNPYTWCGSLWHYNKEMELPRFSFDSFLEFLDFIEANLQSDIGNRKIKYTSFLQTDYLVDKDDKIIVKHLIPFEDKTKIARQFEELGINYTSKLHINKSNNAGYQMSRVERRRIEHIFAKDFELLGY